jgi:opacity protein-like surface antigen
LVGPLAALAALTAGALALVAAPTVADAGRLRVRVGGSVQAAGHIYIGGGGYRRRHYVRSYYPGTYVGVQFASPPPPPCYECGATAYYVEPAPQPQVAYVAPEPPPPPVPLFGLGVFAGGVDVERGESGNDLGLFARLRLTHHLRLEGEISRTEHDDGMRIDRRMGGALLYDFAPYARLSPYILGGLGAGRTEMDDGRYGAQQGYGELGIGLEWRLTDHLSLIGDLRAGARETRPDDGAVMLQTAPTREEEENYTRGRLGALLFF